MSIIIPVFILVLSMLIFAFLQLAPAIFSLFYHFSLARNSRKKADDLSLNFLLGVEIFFAVIFLAIYFLLYACFYHVPDFATGVFLWIMVGIFCAEALVALFIYYRRGSSTTLFLPRRIATGLTARTKTARSRADAFLLGFFSSLPELILTLPLFIISAIILLHITFLSRTLLIILLFIAPLLPLFCIRTFYRANHNLAEITRFRVRAKFFTRFFLALCYIFIALSLIYLITR